MCYLTVAVVRSQLTMTLVLDKLETYWVLA